MLLNILESILYGLIEGITEWLPVSSTGHLLLLESILPMNVSAEFFEVYLVVIQLGAVAAVCIYFFDKLYPFNKSRKQQNAIYQTWIKIIIGCIPAGIFGILLAFVTEMPASLPLGMVSPLLSLVRTLV